MTPIEKKEIILKNARKILSHIEEKKYPRWSEFINRKIKTYLSALYSAFILKNNDLAEEITQAIIELEIIREYPLLAFGTEELSLEEILEKCNFKYSKNIHSLSDHEGIEGIGGRCEAKYADRSFGSIASYFTTDWSKYNEVVATHYNKVITESDVLALVAASMFFVGFNNSETKDTLYKYFKYEGELPYFYDLKYVAIILGGFDSDERATLSIPSSEMGENESLGDYCIYFHRISKSDVEIHNDSELIALGYDNFSQIYSESFPDNTSSLYLIDEYYAIFA